MKPAVQGPAVRFVYECVRDATSVRGLTKLRREQPTRWVETLASLVRANRTHRPRTLSQWLVFGAAGDLLPSGHTDRPFLARRASARRWLRWCAVPVAAIDERMLTRIVDQRRQEGRDSAATFARDRAQVRTWVRMAQCDLGLQLRVGPRWPSAPTGVARSRDVASFDDTHDLFRIATPETRVMIALAVGARLTGRELTGARFEGLTPDYSALRIEGGSRRGRPGATVGRTVALPPWVQDLAVQAWGLTPPATGFCFPGRLGRRRRDLDGQMRRLAARAGIEVTLTSLRSLGQSVARAFDGSRLAVRGVVRGVDGAGRTTREGQAFAADQRALAEAWARFDEPPCTLDLLPRRAPKACRPEEPETKAARRQVRERFGAPLPASVLRNG